MRQSTRQYIVSTYGKSVHEIALDVATEWFVNKTSGFSAGAKFAWEQADAFLKEMDKRCGQQCLTEQPGAQLGIRAPIHNDFT